MTEEEIFVGALPLVKFTIAKYVRRRKESWRDIDDLYQDGCIGLLKAVRTYDESAGFAFSTYAIRCILNYIATARKRNQIPTTSLDKVVSVESGRETTLLQLLPDTSNDWERIDTQNTVSAVIRQMRSSDRYSELSPVLLGEKTQQQMAEELGVTRQAIQQRISRFRQELKAVV